MKNPVFLIPMRIVPVVLIVSFCLFCSMLIVAVVRAENREVTVQDAFTLLQEPNPDLVVLDIRSPREFRSGHISGAVMLNFSSPVFQTILAQLPRHQPYLLYCRSATRSDKAFQLMKNMGFTEVTHMKGGTLQWVEQGLPLVRSSYAGGH